MKRQAVGSVFSAFLFSAVEGKNRGVKGKRRGFVVQRYGTCIKGAVRGAKIRHMCQMARHAGLLNALLGRNKDARSGGDGD